MEDRLFINNKYKVRGLPPGCKPNFAIYKLLKEQEDLLMKYYNPHIKISAHPTYNTDTQQLKLLDTPTQQLCHHHKNGGYILHVRHEEVSTKLRHNLKIILCYRCLEHRHK